eukprot:12905965-Alexandrium_andersonii.AAC.1
MDSSRPKRAHSRSLTRQPKAPKRTHPWTEPPPRRGASDSRMTPAISRAHRWAASGNSSNGRISGFGFKATARG